MKIGVFDSGIGGLTVLHQAMLTLPKEEYLFYADADHVPYGEKTHEEIVRYVDEAVRFLLAKGVAAIVIACNTATSVAIETMRRRYRVPLLGIEPAIKPAVQGCYGKRIMVIATPVTVREKRLKDLIARVDEEHHVDLLATPKLVTLAEKEEFNTPEAEQYLRSVFEPYNLAEYSSLVLGCTHFNYFKDTLRRIFPAGVDFLDGSAGTVNHLADTLHKMKSQEVSVPAVTYYCSGRIITAPAELARIERLHRRLDQMLHI